MPVFNLFAAFLFGFLSFLSPCILPLLPGYLSFLAGSNTVLSRYHIIQNAAGFVLGFSIVFISMGALASSFGQLLTEHQVLLTRLAGIIIILFGLHLSELLPFHLLLKQRQWQKPLKISGWPGAFLLGLSFATGWTPCVGPVLASILILASNSDTLGQGILLLSAYAAGLAVPFLLSAAGITLVYQRIQSARRFLPYINAVSGGLLITMGIMFLTGKWQQLASFLIIN